MEVTKEYKISKFQTLILPNVLNMFTPFKKKVVWSKIWRAMPTMKFGLSEYLVPVRIEKINIMGAP